MIYQVGKSGQRYLSATPHRPPPLPPWRGGESLGEVYTMYKAKLYDEEYNVDLEVGHYSNGRLAILLTDARDGSPFSRLTVNIPTAYCPKDCAYLDTNTFRKAEQFVVENGLAESMEEVAFSGYCKYPLYKFNMNLI